MQKSPYPKHRGMCLTIPILLILIGLVFLGFNLGFITKSFKEVLISWQMLLILVGIIRFIKHRFANGLILILVGVFFIIPRLIQIFPSIDPNYTQTFWPLLLIGVGILLIFERECKNRCRKKEFTWNEKCRNKKQNNHKWSQSNVFGSGEHIVIDPIFEGGEINVVFGGISLDLRPTSLALGNTYLEVNAVFGGITIIAPNDWVIETHFDTLIGGFQDNRRHPSKTIDSGRKLIIKGACVFGGGEIKN